MAAPALAQETTATAEADPVATDTLRTAAQAPDDDDSDTTHAIVILGEIAGLNPDSPRKDPFPELVAVAQARLGTDVVDYTSVGLTLADTLQMVQAAPMVQADVVLLLAGLEDSRQELAEDQIRANVVRIADELRQRNPQMRIFLMPSATYLNTIFSAQLRLAASDANVTFVPLGTEVGGQPFREAMAEVTLELQSQPDEAPPAPQLDPGPSISVAEDPTTAPAEALPSATAPSYAEGRADLQRELNRIAGDTSDSGILPLNVEELSSQTLTQQPAATGAETTGTEIPPGGRITKRGREAQENINMRPLPALKAFEPQVPVPRNQIDVKEPALSR